MTPVTRPQRERVAAGTRIAAALKDFGEGDFGLRTAARMVVEGEHPNLNGATKKRLIEQWRRYFQRWVGKPATYISAGNARIVERYFKVPAEDLVKPELTDDEKRIAKAERLEEQARRLRRGDLDDAP